MTLNKAVKRLEFLLTTFRGANPRPAIEDLGELEGGQVSEAIKVVLADVKARLG